MDRSSLETRARSLQEKLCSPEFDVCDVAHKARSIFMTALDPVRTRWLDLELFGYAWVADARPLHEILGVPAGARLASDIAAYRAQVGRRWTTEESRDQLVHFFVEPLAKIVAARERVHAARVTGLIDLSFTDPPGADLYPSSATFPADIFDRILLGFSTVLHHELEEVPL